MLFPTLGLMLIILAQITILNIDLLAGNIQQVHHDYRKIPFSFIYISNKANIIH